MEQIWNVLKENKKLILILLALLIALIDVVKENPKGKTILRITLVCLLIIAAGFQYISDKEDEDQQLARYKSTLSEINLSFDSIKAIQKSMLLQSTMQKQIDSASQQLLAKNEALQKEDNNIFSHVDRSLNPLFPFDMTIKFDIPFSDKRVSDLTAYVYKIKKVEESSPYAITADIVFSFITDSMAGLEIHNPRYLLEKIIRPIESDPKVKYGYRQTNNYSLNEHNTFADEKALSDLDSVPSYFDISLLKLSNRNIQLVNEHTPQIHFTVGYEHDINNCVANFMTKKFQFSIVFEDCRFFNSEDNPSNMNAGFNDLLNCYLMFNIKKGMKNVTVKEISIKSLLGLQDYYVATLHESDLTYDAKNKCFVYLHKNSLLDFPHRRKYNLAHSYMKYWPM